MNSFINYGKAALNPEAMVQVKKQQSSFYEDVLVEILCTNIYI